MLSNRDCPDASPCSGFAGLPDGTAEFTDNRPLHYTGNELQLRMRRVTRLLILQTLSLGLGEGWGEKCG